MKVFFTVYKITNNTNGRYYIGAHQTRDLDDGYLGSGSLILEAVKTYGKSAFTKEILGIFATSVEMYDFEAALVTEELIKDTMCYNLIRGGRVGERSTISLQVGQKLAMERQAELKLDEQWREQKRLRQSAAMRERWRRGDFCDIDFSFFSGMSHSGETKRKIGEKNSAFVGEKNSQFGTCWVFNPDDQVSKKIKLSDLQSFVSRGWVKGRKIKFV